MRKLLLLTLAALLVFAFGCSGGTAVTPDERVSMDDYFASITIDQAIAGYYSITDIDGNIVSEGYMVRDDDGKLAMGELRQGDIYIDLTWLGWVDCNVDYLNPRGYTAQGYSIYYIGDTVEYDLCVLNYSNAICCANIQSEQRYYGGAHHGELLPGDAIETWLDYYLPYGETCLNDSYYIPSGAYCGLDMTWARVWFSYNIWFLHFDIILYDCVAGIWDP